MKHMVFFIISISIQMLNYLNVQKSKQTWNEYMEYEKIAKNDV